MTRERLPQRRHCETISFKVGDTRFHGTIGTYDDGRIGEIFLNGAKIGSDLQIAAQDSAIIASLALQYGAPLDKMKEALTRTPDGEPEGPLGAFLDILFNENTHLQEIYENHDAERV